MKRIVEIYIRLAELETKKEVEVYPIPDACLVLCISSFTFFELELRFYLFCIRWKKTQIWLREKEFEAFGAICTG